MFEPTLRSVMYLDTDNDMIHIYTAGSVGGDPDHFIGAIKASIYDESFSEKLGEIIDSYRETHPAAQLGKLSVIIPDTAVITDTLNVPTLGKSAMNKSVDVLISNLYSNSAELVFNRFVALAGKEYATFAVDGVRRDLLISVRKALADRGISIANITYAANAEIDALLALSPKLRGGTFVFLDVKDGLSRVIFVQKGRTVGFYTIPFGAEILSEDSLVSEDALFDHSAADLVVLRSKERARAKAPLQTEAEDEQEDDDIDQDEAEQLEVAHRPERRSGRKVPRSLIRPIPDSSEGFVYENMRHILKWALSAISENVSITSLGAPECMYINLPKKHAFLYDMLAASSEECGILLTRLPIDEGKEAVLGDLELYGGFYAKQHNKVNNFRAAQPIGSALSRN